MNLSAKGTLLAALVRDLTLVELELGALEDVTIGTAALAGARADASKQTAAAELLIERRVEDTGGLARGGAILRVARTHRWDSSLNMLNASTRNRRTIPDV